MIIVQLEITLTLSKDLNLQLSFEFFEWLAINETVEVAASET